jgi:hypothetical protein
MLWEAVAVDIVLAGESGAAVWLDTPLDLWSDELLASWDWHGLFHEELADGQGGELPTNVSPRKLVDWIVAQTNSSDASLMVAPSIDYGTVAYALMGGAEPRADIGIATCALVAAASAAGATCRLLMLGGHDPHNMYGYPDDYTHVLIRQPGSDESGVAYEAFEQLMMALSGGKLEEAFQLAADNPLIE